MRLPKYNSKKSRNYFQPNSDPAKAHKNGYRLAMREVKHMLDETLNKNYYFWIDDNGRLTLELTDKKPIQECISITAHTINRLSSVYSEESEWGEEEMKIIKQLRSFATKQILDLINDLIGEDETSEDEIEHRLFYATRNGLRQSMRDKL